MKSDSPAPRAWRIALADDHAIVRMGFRRLLELEPDLSVVAEYADADATQAALCGPEHLPLDLLILDLSMPGRSGLDLLRTLHDQRPELVVLVVSMHDSMAMISHCQAAGASGFVPKGDEPDAVVRAVRRLLAGERGIGLPERATRAAVLPRDASPHMSLTGRETEVLHLLLAGHGIDASAQRLGLSEKTVSNYQTLIRQKLGVSGTVELVHYARVHGLMP